MQFHRHFLLRASLWCESGSCTVGLGRDSCFFLFGSLSLVCSAQHAGLSNVGRGVSTDLRFEARSGVLFIGFAHIDRQKIDSTDWA